MAGANKEPPLDETVWANPQWAGMINPNNVLTYFLGSPFFDRASNNASLFMQAQNPNNYQLHYLLQNRGEFEARLRTMVGIEFVVAMEDPSQGVYIIKKQLRKNPDEATALEAYFIIGENIIMAPTVYSVLMNRMLSSLTLISKAHSLAASMSSFTPDSGYSYPDNAPTSTTSQTNVSLSQTSVASTPVPSGAAAASSASAAAGTSSSTSGTEAKSAQQRREEASLLHSLSLSLRFASGQPGGFLDDNNITDPQAILVSTSASSSQQQQHGQGGSQGSSQGSGGGSQQQQPPKLDTKAGKDSKGKGGAGSPTSPTSPTNTNTMKKRRKSKAAPAAAASQD